MTIQAEWCSEASAVDVSGAFSKACALWKKRLRSDSGSSVHTAGRTADQSFHSVVYLQPLISFSSLLPTIYSTQYPTSNHSFHAALHLQPFLAFSTLPQTVRFVRYF